MEVKMRVCLFVLYVMSRTMAQDLHKDCSIRCYSSDRLVTWPMPFYPTTVCPIGNTDREDTDLNSLNVVLQPTVYKVFKNPKLCNEMRWFPGLNVTWSVQENDIWYGVEWSELPHWSDDHQGYRTSTPKCVKMDISPHREYRDKIKQCTLTCSRVDKNNIYINIIAGSDGKHVTGRDTITTGSDVITTGSGVMISFREVRPNLTYSSGLPMFYRRKDLNLNTDGLLPSPRYWTPIIEVHNISMLGQVRVKFDLAPLGMPSPRFNHLVDYYNITLIPNPSSELEKTVMLYPRSTDEFGDYTFSNVTPGQYFIEIRTRSQGLRPGRKGCASLLGNTVRVTERDPRHCAPSYAPDNCLKIHTGLFTLNDIPQTTEAPPVEDEMSTIALASSLSAFLCLTLVLIIVLVCVVRDRHNKLARRKGQARPYNNAVFLLYHDEDHLHHDVVNHLKNFLEHLGFYCVLMDQYQVENGEDLSLTPWLEQHLEMAGKIIYIASQGSQKAMKMFENRQGKDICEYLDMKQHLFRTSLFILSESCPQRQCVMAYSNHSLSEKEQHPSAPSYLSNCGKFHLLKDFEQFLLAIHNENEDEYQNILKPSQEKLIYPQMEDLKYSEQYVNLERALNIAEELCKTEKIDSEYRLVPAEGRISLYPPDSTDILSILSGKSWNGSQEDFLISEDSGIKVSF